MSSIREEKKRKTRKAILDAAIKLFSRNGYENTRVEDLAQEAGIGKGTIYGYFKTKSEIFLAFCEDEIEHVFAVENNKSSDSPLAQKLQKLFMRQFRYVTRNNEFGRIVAREMTFPKEVTYAMSKKLEERYISAIGDILQKAIVRNELRSDLELFYVVGHFYSLYLILLSSWYNGRFTTEKEVESALHKLLCQAMEGLAPKR